MENLPPTIFIGIGAVIAAVITALISFINLITSKDETISKNRQNWIDSVREDISRFIALSAFFSSRLKAIELLECEEKKMELTTKLFDNFELVELYNRIKLRLNPDENRKIISALNSIEDFLAGKDEIPRTNTGHMAKLTQNLREESQVMLKKEWKRVKRGELSYVFTKWAFIAGVVVSLTFGLYKLSSYEVSREVVDHTGNSIAPTEPNKSSNSVGSVKCQDILNGKTGR